MCLYPQLIKNPKYKENKKNGGRIPPVLDKRVLWVPIGCGQCMECRGQKKREWQVRLQEDIKKHTNGKFITLTFSNESIAKLATNTEGLKRLNRVTIAKGYDLDNEICIAALRLFNERWRKKHNEALRHFMVTELGHNGTENVHMHGIVWTNETYEEIAKIWQYGHIWPRDEKIRKQTWVNAKTVNYIIKYITKVDKDHEYYKGRVLSSPGIGRNFEDSMEAARCKFNGIDTIQTYRTNTGHKIAMPTYWRNKIYSEDEREKLWLIMMDKNERWIGGEKIDMKVENAERDYFNMVKWYRRINQELGYGTGMKTWDQVEYERIRREMLQTERINDGLMKLENKNKKNSQ